MRPRQGGWRSARFVAPPPQPPSAPATAPEVPRARVARALRSAPAARAGTGGLAGFSRSGSWSISFIGVMAYVYAAVTYGLPIVGPSIVIALIGLAFERTRIVVPPFLVIFLLFTVWAGASYTNSFDKKLTYDSVVVLSKVLLITFVIVNVTTDSWRLRTFMIFFLACFAAYPTRGTLVNYFIVRYTWFGRAVWNFIYANSNDLAALTFFPLGVAIAVALTEKPGWVKKAALVGTAVLPLIILLTQSRGALIALVVSGLTFFVSYSKGRRLKTLLAALTLSVLIVPFVPSSAWQRFKGMGALTSTETVADADPEGSAEARYNIWRVARAIIADYPVSGIGLGAYPPAHSNYAPRVGVPAAAMGFRDTHSTYLNVAAETGLPGLVLFLTMIAFVVVPTERTRRAAKGTPRATQLLALELGLLGFMVAGIFGSFAKLSFLYIQLALMWATAEVTRRELAGQSVGARPRTGVPMRARGRTHVA